MVKGGGINAPGSESGLATATPSHCGREGNFICGYLRALILCMSGERQIRDPE